MIIRCRFFLDTKGVTRRVRVLLENVFVIQTDDKKFKEAISYFLSKYCNDKGVIVAVHEMSRVGAEKVLKVVKEK